LPGLEIGLQPIDPGLGLPLRTVWPLRRKTRSGSA
jgi:hypothetical protein